MIRVLAFLEAETVGGPAKNLLEFARCLQVISSPQVELVIAPFHRGNPHNDFTAAAEAAGIPLHRIAERFAFDRTVLPQMSAIIERVRPHVVQTHAVKSHFLLRLSGEWKRRPWVAFHHGYTMVNTKMLLYNQLDRWSLRRPTRVVTVSEPFARELTSRGVSPDRVSVVHNAIDPLWGEKAQDSEARRRIRAALGIAPDDKVILKVGRLSHEKAHTVLVTAFAQLRDRLPKIPLRLLIVGEGPERPAIESAVSQAGLSGQVILAGYQRDVAPYYAASDLAALSSYTEGSPNALLEAWAARLPLIATSVGGIPEMASPASAWLVPPLDAGALASALSEALSNPELAGAKAAHAYDLILTKFTPQERAQNLSRLYLDVAADSLHS